MALADTLEYASGFEGLHEFGEDTVACTYDDEIVSLERPPTSIPPCGPRALGRGRPYQNVA
jgi:hypothetical protein